MHKTPVTSATPICPQCGTPIVGDDINVSRDVAYCRKCGVAYALSELVGDGTDDDVLNLDNPPKGVWFRNDMSGASMGAQYRSWGGFLGAMVFCIIWDGSLSLIFKVVIAMTLKYLAIPAPVWFPPVADDWNRNILGGHLGDLGSLLFVWLFLSPFILTGVWMPIQALVCLFGKVEVTIQAGVGRLGTKLFGFGRTRKFEPEQVIEVGIVDERWRDDNDTRDVILLRQKNGKKIKFGAGLLDVQQAFLAYALRQVCKVRQTSERRHR
jgi:hypothetical protein